MSLIASISGIRGTIGGDPGKNLTPVDIVNFASAYGVWLTTKTPVRKVVIGRDARPSGPMLDGLVTNVLVALGFEVIHLGLSTTPTVEVAVPDFDAAGGIILTASHNPVEWNALKLLNSKGEFVTKKDGMEILDILEKQLFHFAPVDKLGTITHVSDYAPKHIESILKLPYTDRYAIEKCDFHVVVDGVNSSGGVFVPMLLEALGVSKVTKLNCEPTGNFAHNPEPIKENLGEICSYIRENKADIGIVVDPDVDRLCLVDETGTLFGEEYTLVAAADYVLQHNKGAVVSNLSSSRALRDLAASHGCPYYASAVGEVNVTEKMKRHDAVIGGEGNGGVILPESHYGRDALVGIALILSHLAKSKLTLSKLRKEYADYHMAKMKVALADGVNVDQILNKVEARYGMEKINNIDGVKIDFDESWVHLRKSNTEPIIRIYSEAKTLEAAEELASRFKTEISEMI